MAGESYGVSVLFFVLKLSFHTLSTQGRYLPLFAAEIYDQNSKFEKTGVTPINLSSIMIGNISCRIWRNLADSFGNMQEMDLLIFTHSYRPSTKKHALPHLGLRSSTLGGHITASQCTFLTTPFQNLHHNETRCSSVIFFCAGSHWPNLSLLTAS